MIIWRLWRLKEIIVDSVKERKVYCSSRNLEIFMNNIRKHNNAARRLKRDQCSLYGYQSHQGVLVQTSILQPWRLKEGIVDLVKELNVYFRHEIGNSLKRRKHT